MNESNSTHVQLHEMLETAGIDERALFFVLLMLAISAGTCLAGTAILTAVTQRNRRLMQASRERTAANRAPTVLGAASPGQVDVADIAFLARPQGQEAVTKKQRFWQVLSVFLCTFLLSASVALLGLWDGSLSTERGLAWESYTLLLSAGCTWLLIQTLLVAKNLPAGKGYATTAFAEAMVSAVMPFASDAFDTLKDVLFGALCFKSRHLGVQILGGISWVYLLAFHLVLLRRTQFLTDFATTHIALFVSPTIDLQSEPVRMSKVETLVVQVGRQLTPAKRQMLLVENVPQALLAVLYLAIEGGSLLVALLNVAQPSAQILASILLYPRLKPQLGKWFAKRVDAALDAKDLVLWKRLQSEIDERLMRHVAPHGHHLKPIVSARNHDLIEAGHIITDTAADDLAAKVCVKCLNSHDGGLLLHGRDLHGRDLGGQPALLKAVATFAVSAVWVIELSLAKNRLTDDDLVALAPVLATGAGLEGLWLHENSIGDRGAEALAAALPHISGLKDLVLLFNQIREPGARALAAKLSECPALTYLDMRGNEVGAEAEEALRKACREHRPVIRLYI